MQESSHSGTVCDEAVISRIQLIIIDLAMIIEMDFLYDANPVLWVRKRHLLSFSTDTNGPIQCL